MITPILAVELQPSDVLAMRDWRNLHVAEVTEGDWSDRAGRHHGMIVITREFGSEYPLHFAVAETIQVDRAL